jgi:hypothetical protein
MIGAVRLSWNSRTFDEGAKSIPASLLVCGHIGGSVVPRDDNDATGPCQAY